MLLVLATTLSGCGSTPVPTPTPIPAATATGSPVPTEFATATASSTTLPTPSASATPGPATVADITGGPLMPSYEVPSALARYGSGDVATPLAVCEGRPLKVYALKGPKLAAGERLLACTVAVAAGWRAYTLELGVGPGIAADYLAGERALYSYAITALGPAAKSAIDSVLTDMGSGSRALHPPRRSGRSTASSRRGRVGRGRRQRCTRPSRRPRCVGSPPSFQAGPMPRQVCSTPRASRLPPSDRRIRLPLWEFRMGPTLGFLHRTASPAGRVRRAPRWCWPTGPVSRHRRSRPPRATPGGSTRSQVTRGCSCT